MSANVGENDEDVPQGGVTEREDGIVGMMRKWRVRWGREEERDGEKEGGGNYCTACFLS